MEQELKALLEEVKAYLTADHKAVVLQNPVAKIDRYLLKFSGGKEVAEVVMDPPVITDPPVNTEGPGGTAEESGREAPTGTQEAQSNQE